MFLRARHFSSKNFYFITSSLLSGLPYPVKLKKISIGEMYDNTYNF